MVRSSLWRLCGTIIMLTCSASTAVPGSLETLETKYMTLTFWALTTTILLTDTLMVRRKQTQFRVESAIMRQVVLWDNCLITSASTQKH